VRKAIPWILLSISLAFNVFFVVGMRRAHRHRRLVETAEGRVQLLAEKLDMDAEQRAKWLALEKGVWAEHQAFKKEIAAQVDAFWSEMIKDKPDASALQAFVQSAPGPQRRRRFVEHMQGLMAILRPEQRQRAAEFFKRHHPRRGRRR